MKENISKHNNDKRRKWWKTLQEDDPISLEPISQLGYEPFDLKANGDISVKLPHDGREGLTKASRFGSTPRSSPTTSCLRAPSLTQSGEKRLYLTCNGSLCKERSAADPSLRRTAKLLTATLPHAG